jgi:uncharacterized membrane protein
MTGILTSLSRTILAGFALLAAILLMFANQATLGSPEWLLFSLRWLHVLCGVMWLGLLWYFNVVQIPSMPLIPDEQKPAISKVIAPRALLWFRYAALGDGSDRHVGCDLCRLCASGIYPAACI